MIRTDETKDLDEPKTMKISLPARLHVKLHSLKILGGVTISETVEEAIVGYFERGDHEDIMDAAGMGADLLGDDVKPG